MVRDTDLGTPAQQFQLPDAFGSEQGYSKEDTCVETDNWTICSFAENAPWREFWCHAMGKPQVFWLKGHMWGLLSTSAVGGERREGAVLSRIFRLFPVPPGRPYRGKPSDMWALGVVLFTMLYGQFPFYDSIPQELFRKIKAAEYTIPE